MMESLGLFLAVIGGIASMVALWITAYQIGLRKARHSNAAVKPSLFPVTGALERFIKASLSSDAVDLDMIGYSVHALLDTLQPITKRALEAGKRVRILILTPMCTGLLEKSALEQKHQNVDLNQFRNRNTRQIERTLARLHDLAQDVKYQSNIAHVPLEVRAYNQFPIYRGVSSGSGIAVSSSYLVDTARPGRELEHFFWDGKSVTDQSSQRELKSFQNWFEYLWTFRSHPIQVECLVFDLYDTLITIPAEKRHAARCLMAQLMDTSVDDLERQWEATRPASNKGEIPSTEARFNRIFELLGKPSDSALAQQLADIEHKMLRASAQYCPGAEELLKLLRNHGYKLAISSNCSMSAFNSISATGIAAHVDLIRLSCELGELKPNEANYVNPIEALDSDPSRTVFIGDGANDELRGAKNLGITAVEVGPKAKDSSADFSIRTLAELPSVLERVAKLVNDERHRY